MGEPKKTVLPRESRKEERPKTEADGGEGGGGCINCCKEGKEPQDSDRDDFDSHYASHSPCSG